MAQSVFKVGLQSKGRTRQLSPFLTFPDLDQPDLDMWDQLTDFQPSIMLKELSRLISR